MQQKATTTKVTQRIPKILELEIQGYTNNQIAQTLGVERTAIWRNKQEPLYLLMLEQFLDKYTQKIDDLIDSGTPSTQIEMIKELGRMYRAGMTKRSETKSAHLDIQMHIDNNRTQLNTLWNGLSLSAQEELRGVLMKDNSMDAVDGS